MELILYTFKANLPIKQMLKPYSLSRFLFMKWMSVEKWHYKSSQYDISHHLYLWHFLFQQEKRLHGLFHVSLPLWCLYCLSFNLFCVTILKIHVTIMVIWIIIIVRPLLKLTQTYWYSTKWLTHIAASVVVIYSNHWLPESLLDHKQSLSLSKRNGACLVKDKQSAKH